MKKLRYLKWASNRETDRTEPQMCKTVIWYLGIYRAKSNQLCPRSNIFDKTSFNVWSKFKRCSSAVSWKLFRSISSLLRSTNGFWKCDITLVDFNRILKFDYKFKYIFVFKISSTSVSFSTYNDYQKQIILFELSKIKTLKLPIISENLINICLLAKCGTTFCRPNVVSFLLLEIISRHVWRILSYIYFPVSGIFE